jgi:hypothetical protein
MVPVEHTCPCSMLVHSCRSSWRVCRKLGYKLRFNQHCVLLSRFLNKYLARKNVGHYCLGIPHRLIIWYKIEKLMIEILYIKLHPLWFEHSDYIPWGMQILKFLMQDPPILFLLPTSWAQKSSSVTYSWTPSVLPLIWATKFYPHIQPEAKFYFCML